MHRNPNDTSRRALLLLLLLFAACGGDEAQLANTNTGSPSQLGSGATMDGGGGGSDASSPRADGGGGVKSDGGGADGGGVKTDSGGTPVDAGAKPTQNECTNARPEWLFCNGFEEGSFSAWDDYDGNPAPFNSLPADPGPFGIGGNHVMRLYAPPGRGGADAVKVLNQSGDHVFARWYMQWEPGYDFNAPNHGSGLHAGDRNWLGHSDTRPDGTDWFSSWIEPHNTTHKLQAYTYYRGMYQDFSNPNGACWGDHFPCMYDANSYCTKPADRQKPQSAELTTGAWYCIEMELDAGTPTQSASAADGRLDAWVNGEELGPWPNLWLRTSSSLSVGILWLSTFYHGDHADAGVRFDNVVVSSQRIGCP